MEEENALISLSWSWETFFNMLFRCVCSLEFSHFLRSRFFSREFLLDSLLTYLGTSFGDVLQIVRIDKVKGLEGMKDRMCARSSFLFNCNMQCFSERGALGVGDYMLRQLFVILISRMLGHLIFEELT